MDLLNEGDRWPGTNAWIHPVQRRRAVNVRLICLPYAGGSTQHFRTWPEELPPSVEVCSVELPGRNARLKEPPFTQFDPLVRAIAKAILPCLNVPFALFGHSMGALIAFELGRLLARKHRLEPVHLFVAGSQAPQLPDPYPPLHALPEPEFKAELRRLNGTPAEILDNPEMMQLVSPILRADLEVSETYAYRPRPRLNCPITAFGGLGERIGRDLLDPWQHHTSSTFDIRMLPGGHFFVHTAKHLLLRIISRELRKCAPMAEGRNPERAGER
jgi:medium-chain acyl-[acyl-carrier-protein] hydrolase